MHVLLDLWGVLLDRSGAHDKESLLPFVRAVLRNLAGLPPSTEVLAAEVEVGPGQRTSE